jgi:hypothetical protein
MPFPLIAAFGRRRIFLHPFIRQKWQSFREGGLATLPIWFFVFVKLEALG